MQLKCAVVLTRLNYFYLLWDFLSKVLKCLSIEQIMGILN
jgi:hypothetical protein